MRRLVVALSLAVVAGGYFLFTALGATGTPLAQVATTAAGCGELHHPPCSPLPPSPTASPTASPTVSPTPTPTPVPCQAYPGGPEVTGPSGELTGPNARFSGSTGAGNTTGFSGSGTSGHTAYALVDSRSHGPNCANPAGNRVMCGS